MPDLAVIIVTWNVRHLVLEALRTLYADLQESGLEADVYVVDSASADGTPQAVAVAFPQVRLLASETNLGFAGGNNHALRAIGFGGSAPAGTLPRAVYLLNPDTLTHPGATRGLYEALFAEDGVGLVGAQLFYEDGSFQHGAFAFPGLRQLWAEFFPLPGRLIEGRFNGRYPRVLYEAGRPFAVDFTLGATMMLRREVILQTGMFDEGFFMYCEEIDWAWRIQRAGWQVRTVPAAHITHLVGRSTSQERPRSITDLWRSRMLLYRKHYPGWKLWLARRLVMAGVRRRQRAIRSATGLDETEREALLAAYDAVYEMAREL